MTAFTSSNPHNPLAGISPTRGFDGHPGHQPYSNNAMFYSSAIGESNASILDMKQLKLLRIYEDLCTVTTNQRLRDFFWFNRPHIYQLIDKLRVQEGVWSNDGIHATVSSNMSILVGSREVSIRISYDHAQCDIRKNDDASDITIDDIKNGIIPSLKLIMHLCGLEYEDDYVPDVDLQTQDYSDYESATTVTTMAKKPERVGRGPRLTYCDIKAILMPYIKDINSLDILSTNNLDLWFAICKNQRLHELDGSDIQVVVDRTESCPVIYLSNSIWSTKLICIDSGTKRPYYNFCMIDANNTDDVKAIAAILDMLYLLTKGE